jgi:signal transduction histidine kinase
MTRYEPLPGVGTSTLLEIGDALDVGILSVDASLVVTTWNRWLETASGLTASSVVGQPLTELAHRLKPAARGAFQRAVRGATVIMSHGLHEYFIELPPPAGREGFSRMQQSARILPTLDADGAWSGAVALIQDVTERVEREASLRAAMVEAQRANQTKSDFLAAMSHELRTPIGAMSGYADLLADDIFGPVSEVQRAQLRRIKSVGTHLLSIVEEILTFARMEAGHEVMSYAMVNAGVVARQALDVIDPLAAKKGLELSVDIPVHKIELRTDEVRVRQILINLLGNAAKFTTAGRVALTLRATNAGDVVFEISDTGSGIAPDDLQRIFEPFVQVEGGWTRTHSGTGLGLSVSRGLARLLGGEVSAVSREGSGSTFTLTLPPTTTP